MINQPGPVYDQNGNQIANANVFAVPLLNYDGTPKLNNPVFIKDKTYDLLQAFKKFTTNIVLIL